MTCSCSASGVCIACHDALESRVRGLEIGREQDRTAITVQFSAIDKRISVEMAKIRTAIWIVGVLWAVFLAWQRR